MRTAPSGVLDSSALLAAIYGERGGDRVRALAPSSVISAVNLAETVYALVRRGIPRDESLMLLRRLGAAVEPFTPEMGVLAGTMLDKHGLSLGDRACLATARALGLPAITAIAAGLSSGRRSP